MRRMEKEKGVALLIALLIVALITSVATSLVYRLQLSLESRENQRGAAQGQVILQAALDFAGFVLQDDLKRSSNDNLTEPWAQPVRALPVEGGEISGSLTDMQGLFNLNNLVLATNTETREEYKNITKRLFKNLSIDEGTADDLTNNLISFMSVLPSSKSAKSAAASDQYLPPRQPLIMLNDILLVDGFDREIFDKIRNYVTFLPETTAINVNTAPAELIAAAIPTMSISDAKIIVSKRGTSPFSDMNQFLGALPVAMANFLRSRTTIQVESILSTRSSYFQAISWIRYGKLQKKTVALLVRGGPSWPRIVWRQS